MESFSAEAGTVVNIHYDQEGKSYLVRRPDELQEVVGHFIWRMKYADTGFESQGCRASLVLALEKIKQALNRSQ